VTDVRIVAADDDGFRASVTTSGESLTDAFATHGGRLASVDVEGGVLDVVANLPRSVDVQAVREALRDRYPDVELVDYRTGARVRPSARGFRGTVEDDLTDKQWTALELAHRGGYFAWPRRDSDASDLADAMGITPQTFHEHLRKAQRALVSSFFEAGEEEPDDAR
jgi:hypothetical protein